MKRTVVPKSDLQELIKLEQEKGYTCISVTDHFFTEDVVAYFIKDATEKYIVEECCSIDEIQTLLNHYHKAGYRVDHHTIVSDACGYFNAVYVFVKK